MNRYGFGSYYVSAFVDSGPKVGPAQPVRNETAANDSTNRFMNPPAVGHSRNAMWTVSLFNGLESSGVQRGLWSKSLVHIPKACLGNADLAAAGVPRSRDGRCGPRQKVIIVNQPGASGSIGRWPPRRLRQINTRLIDADEAGPNVRLRVWIQPTDSSQQDLRLPGLLCHRILQHFRCT